MYFTHELGDGYALALRTPEFAEEQHARILKNLTRLQRWEHWAHEVGAQPDAAYMKRSMEAYLSGNSVPCVILRGTVLVGSIELRIEPYHQVAEIGYWIDEDDEGRGVVTRACRVLMSHAETLGMRRLELQIAPENTRSVAVAERLGFTYEGTRASAMRVADRRLDAAVYGLVLAEIDAPSSGSVEG